MPIIVILLFIVVLLVIIVGALISIYNNLIRRREMIFNAKGQIATQIESRWDALTNLIQATKQYSEHEKEVLMNITMARSKQSKNSSVGDIEKDEAMFQNALHQINVVAENYPDLKASQIYQSTMESVKSFEDNVRHSRMIYNDTVTAYNRSIKAFPTSLFAGPLGFEEEDYFLATETKQEMPQW